ncbi:MAG: septal ring lytic transglycosylase RlpA family protein [Janthinobacterium lividum]
MSAFGRGDAARRTIARAASAVLFVAGAFVLAGCTVTPDPAASAMTGPTPPAPASASSGTGLRPLARDINVPPGAPPRSTVTAVNYELFSSGSDVPLEGVNDGIPGDRSPAEFFQRGGASWYGIQFHQRRTANGERFDMSAFTAAHRTLPFGTPVCVRSLTNGREVLVRVNDRGPFGPGRIIDLSRAAADAIDMVGLGIKQVAITVMDGAGMRCGGAPVDRAALSVLGGTGGEAATLPTQPAAAPRRLSRARSQR